jgi:hypothetical protein
VPLATVECPLCGHAFGAEDIEGTGTVPPGSLSGIVMSEIDLLKRSSFDWVDLFGADDALMAAGFTAWGGVLGWQGVWYAVGGRRGVAPRLLAIGERMVWLAAADDWLNEHETDESAFKSQAWLRQPPTGKQLQYLPPECRHDYSLTRYAASARITFAFNRRAIADLIEGAIDTGRRAA